MSTHNDSPQNAMAIAERHLMLGQVRAAMDAMMEQVQGTSATPVCMAIVDASGNMEAFAKMDHARIFTRRHAVRKGLHLRHPGHEQWRLGAEDGQHRPECK